MNNLVGGFNLPLWKMMEFVRDDETPKWMEKQNMFQTTNQIISQLKTRDISGMIGCSTRFNPLSDWNLNRFYKVGPLDS